MLNKKSVHHVTNVLSKFNVKVYTIQSSDIDNVDADVVIVIGRDSDVLKILHKLKLPNPILGVDELNSPGFLTEVGIDDFTKVVSNLINKEYKIESYLRLKVLVDGVETPHAMNEVALFPKRSAVMLEYKLLIGGEEVWRDCSDGVIVSTPIGSTAYAMSAGGPMLHPHIKSYVIVPVNSLDLTRRSLVVPSSIETEISEISSRSNCEVIIDGIYRKVVEKCIKVIEGNPAFFIKFKTPTSFRERITKKIHLTQDLMSIPPSAKLVMKVLEYEGPLTQKDIINKTALPGRTVRHALQILISKGMVKRKISLRDLRQAIYYIP